MLYQKVKILSFDDTGCSNCNTRQSIYSRMGISGQAFRQEMQIDTTPTLILLILSTYNVFGSRAPCAKYELSRING